MREMSARTPDDARWFRGDGADLFVWDDDQGAITGFHFISRTGSRERVFRWDTDSGAHYSAVIEDESRKLHPGSGLLAPQTLPVPPEILLDFDRLSQRIDFSVRDHILNNMRNALGEQADMAPVEENVSASCHAAAPVDPFRLALSATVHCLTGCVIGESIGLLIGVSLGWPPLAIAAFATILAFISGFALTLIPMVKAGQSVGRSLRLVWLGEVVSISTMEIAMNGVDFLMGGMTAGSVFTSQFWLAMLAAVVAGYLAGLPVNYWMLKRGIKEKCH